MHSWVFRHRHQLRAIYGLPPEARVQQLLDSAREAASTKAARMAEAGTVVAVDGPDAAPDELAQIELRPKAKRA